MASLNLLFWQVLSAVKAQFSGSDVAIDTSKGVKVNNSTVTTPDVAADNGVIHIIDTVLMPA